MGDALTSPWRLSHRADPSAARIADRHYSRQHVGADQFVPPGRCLCLLAHDGRSVWTTSWPYAEFVAHRWGGAWMNSLFRREGGDTQASDMIRAAVAHTRAKWPEVPELGMVTFIDPTKVKGTKVRGRTMFGYSYLKAGFRHVGETKGGLLAFQLLEADMPDPEPVLPQGLLLW